MPFVALRKSTGERINIMTVPDPRATIARDDLVCPLCGQPMTVVAGFYRIKHFRHRSKCETELQGHPETVEHMVTKWMISEIIRDEYAARGIPLKSIDFEVPFFECNRIADVVVSFETGAVEVHEIQLAPITTESLADRTNDYFSAGASVVWWLGRSADTNNNRAWCLTNFGECRFLPMRFTFASEPNAIQYTSDFDAG